MALGLFSLPALCRIWSCSLVSWFTALLFRMVMSASFATCAAASTRFFCTYLSFDGRSSIWFNCAAFCRMLRFSSSIFRASRARCTRFSATAFAMAMSSSRCWRAVSMATAFRCACFCSKAARLRSLSASHSMISFSCTSSEYSALSARCFSCRSCHASSFFSLRSFCISSFASSSISCRSAFMRFTSCFISRS